MTLKQKLRNIALWFQDTFQVKFVDKTGWCSSEKETIDYKNSELDTMDLRFEECKKDLSECRRQKDNILNDLHREKEAHLEIANKYLAIRNKPFESAKLPPPKVLRTLTKSSVIRNISRYFPDAEIFGADDKYSLISKESVKKFLLDTKVDRVEYKPESNDCDEYSLILLSRFLEWGRQLDHRIAVGELWVDTARGKHALNLVLVWGDSNQTELWIIEPQRDTIYKVPDDYKGIMVRI